MQTEKVYILKIFVDKKFMLSLHSLDSRVLENTMRFFDQLVKEGHMSYETDVFDLFNTGEDMAKSMIDGYKEFEILSSLKKNLK